MSLRKRYLITAAAFAGAALIFLGRYHGSEPAPLAGAAGAAGNGHEARPFSALSSPRVWAAPFGSAQSADPEEMGDELAQDENAAGSQDYEDSPMGDILRDILKEDPSLASFRYFYDRPLLDAESRSQYEKLLSDKAMFAETSHDLLYPEERTEDLRGNVKRLMKIDYLRSALEWEENPERRALLSTIESTILTDNLPKGMGDDMKISLAGNKMELYALLYDLAPEHAMAVTEQSRGTRVEQLVQYIAESIALRRQKERESDAVVTL